MFLLSSRRRQVKILDYIEREQLKKENYTLNADLAHYHRFLEAFLKGDSRFLCVVPVTFDDYICWKKMFPGWSDGRLTHRHAAWHPSYSDKSKPMNDVYDEYL
jgi:hypothetical protein